MKRRPRRGWQLAGFLLLLAALALVWRSWQSWQRRTLVVYCSHDAIFAEGLLREFERRTGQPLAIRYDTEATKSLGLVELLLRERQAPRCDVFWNGEPLALGELAEQDLLVPYRGRHFDTIPPQFRDERARWTGFSARLRVWIVNTRQLPGETAAAEITGRLRTQKLTRFAIAKPLYGTTLTHYAALWDGWNPAALQRWHRETRAAGRRELNGNAAVKDAVAAGICDFGLTDTDDFFHARDAGAPVAMLPVWLEDGTTLCIPNAVGIIRGTPRLAAAQQLVDFLTSPESELQLARSAARQIPLGEVSSAQLGSEVASLQQLARYGRDLRGLQAARAACLQWLKEDAAP